MKPILDKNISIKDFKDYYWLKEELLEFCRLIGINSSGGKIDISNSILDFLEKGEIITNTHTKRTNKISTFDWNKEKLDINTLITDNYKNTENVRAFFQSSIGIHFKFNVAFMNWMKVHEGKTLGDAVHQWMAITKLKKDKNHKTQIAPQFEYNRYMREFLADNPNMTTKDAINSWKIKRDKPGIKKYSREDLVCLSTNKNTEPDK